MVMLLGKGSAHEDMDQRLKKEDGKSWCRGPCLGKGSFGTVYLGTVEKTQWKFNPLPPQMAVKSAEYSVSTTLKEERKVLSNMKVFRHIIRCFGKEITAGVGGEKVYNLLLEYASGGSLHDVIFYQTCCFGLPETDVRRYTRSIVEGIKHVHSRGYAHCAIKPDNILLVPTKSCGGSTIYEAKLCDFGLAKKLKKGKKTTAGDRKNLRDTADYMSPEAMEDGIQGPPSDIWAVGIVVLEMLTGRKASMVSGKPNIPNHISEEASTFLRSCFVMNFEDRLTAESLVDSDC